MIRSAETRSIDYKKMLEDIGRNRDIYPPNDETVQWFKSYIRENKNETDKWLKHLIEMKTYENQQLNPPFCYILKNKFAE